MKRLFTIFFIAIAVVNTAVAQNKETRKLDDFRAVSLGEAMKLILVPGNHNEAVIIAKNVDLEEIETRVVGGKLKIELRGNHYKNIEVEITLTYKQITALSVSSAASVRTKGAIKSEELKISISSAGVAKLEVDTQALDISVSSSGDLQLQGRTVAQRVGVSSAGDYMAFDLECREAYVKAASAGAARLKASARIDANASSAGSVKYQGNPEKVTVNSSSGGSVGKVN